MPRSKPAYGQESAAPDALAARASAHREFMWNVAQTHKQWRRTVDRLLADADSAMYEHKQQLKRGH